MSQELVFDKEENIAIMRLNRPDKLNALSVQMRQGMLEAVAKVRADDDIRVLVITGTGRGFCSGADVGMQAARITGEIGQVSRRNILASIGQTGAIIFGLEKPSVAAVNGIAAGAGLSLALACDIRIAAEDAKFTAVWVKRGLIADSGGTYLLPKLLGMSKALELMYTGEMIDAREAERIGLVSKVVPAGELMDTAKEMANKIAKGAPIAIELMKRGAYKALYDQFDAQIEFETYAQKICRATEDHKEGVRSFMEKRDPEFKGR